MPKRKQAASEVPTATEGTAHLKLIVGAKIQALDKKQRSCAALVIRMRGEGHDVAWLPCRPSVPPGVVPDAHAGRIETSLLLHLAPAAVRPHDDVDGHRGALADAMPELRDGRNVLISAHGHSIRALVKHLDDISDDEIERVSLPNGIHQKG